MHSRSWGSAGVDGAMARITMGVGWGLGALVNSAAKLLLPELQEGVAWATCAAADDDPGPPTPPDL